ncbi:hypothetical protein HYALB_00004004 [Hymenoscyphus albidus]|uniref:Uncharacterized protein n=1 Tax=Hymenoscyphus albidus TaxID=595503 RepID=A0A9N9QD45_9HELO|nr:hypothetical protein HYALB_00004004 [Hymenoscyphus albidus]
MPPNPRPKEASAKRGGNQHTGPRNPPTAPESKDPFKGIIQGTAKTSIMITTRRPSKHWEDSKPFEKRAKREDIFRFCGVSERMGYAVIEGYNKGRKEGELPASARTFHNDIREEGTRGASVELASLKHNHWHLQKEFMKGERMTERYGKGS